MENNTTLNTLYSDYLDGRSRGTNTQIDFLSNFADKTGIDVKEHILANWDTTLWTELENILKGGTVSKEVKEVLTGWDKETRGFEEFLVKVFYAWVVEDYLERWLLNSEKTRTRYHVQKGGSDAKRVLLKANCASGDPDLRLVDKKTGEIIHLEVTTDNKGFTSKYNALDLRVRKSGTSKLNDLKAKRLEAGVKKVYIMMVDVENATIRFMEITDSVKILKEFDNPAWKNKRCMRIEIPQDIKRFALAA